MGKSLFIAEKPSVARQFADALKIKETSKNGYIESNDKIVTWCVGHLVSMSYPEVYDESLKKWSFDTIPFLPDKFLYEPIESVKKQFDILSTLLNRDDIDTIYICTDSGREGEYIYRLVDMMINPKATDKRRVWIDSQTEEEIIRGIKEARPMSDYDNLSDAAYLRAIEDYLMGINFSRALSLKFAWNLKELLGIKYKPLSTGRVMTCVLGMVVEREREIRNFVKTDFYKIEGCFDKDKFELKGEWKAVKGSIMHESPFLYNETGFKKEEHAIKFKDALLESKKASIASISNKKEKKLPPLLYNLAELQNDCSKIFKISPDETLKIVQDLYEKKLVTYPRTDARVLSSAIAKQINKNIKGLINYEPIAVIAKGILQKKKYENIEKTKYTDDKKITDHYAIIPTGANINVLNSLNKMQSKVFELIVRRFISIFCNPAIYNKSQIIIKIPFKDKEESFFVNKKTLIDEGYLLVSNPKKENDQVDNNSLSNIIPNMKKGDDLIIKDVNIKKGETSAPKRYSSGAMILAMENAGKLIEDEDLRAQIKSSGIGTSATRAEILKKLVNIDYINLNKKTQIFSPTLFGELVYAATSISIKSLLNPELTASWEKGLSLVENGEVSYNEYLDKLKNFVYNMTNSVKKVYGKDYLSNVYNKIKRFYS